MSDPNPLAGLLEQSVAGDAAALNGLLGRLRPYLHAMVRRRVGAGGGVDESSVVQRAMIRVAGHLGELRAPDVPRLLNWAGRIVANLVADDFRAAGRRPAPLPDADPAVGGPPPDHAAERDEAAVRVAAAMAMLPPRHRQALEWRFWDRLPDAEVAARLATTEGAVRVLRLRALRRLHDLLGPGGDL